MTEKQGTGSSPQRGTNTRMRDRLQASLAGLEELKILRDRQQSLVDDAKSMMGRNKTRRHSFQSHNSLLEYIRPEELSHNRRNSLSVVHEIDNERQENATQNIVETWLQTANTMQKQMRKPEFQIRSPTNSDTKSSKDSSSSISPQNSPRNCDTNAQSEFACKISQDHVIDSEPIKSEDVVDGMDVSKNCDRSETDGAQSSLADVAFEQSVAEISGYSSCSPHRRFSLDASLLAEMQRKPFKLPYGARPRDKQTGAKDKLDTEEVIPTEINTVYEKEKESKQITKEEIAADESVSTPVRLRRRQSFDYTSARAGPPPLSNLQRRSSFSVGVAPSARTSYQKSYTLSGCKTKFNFPSPLHAVLMNRQKVVLSEDNDCAASSSESDTMDTFSRSSDTLYDTDSQVHDGLYNILSQDDSPAKQSKNSPREDKATLRYKTLARDAGKGDLATQATQRQQPPSESPAVPATDRRREPFDSANMGNIRAICNNTRRASAGEVMRGRGVSHPNSTEVIAPPPPKPRLRKSGNVLLEGGVPSRSERPNQRFEARNTQVQSSGQVNNSPRSRGSVDSGMNFYRDGGNVLRSRGSINSVVSALSSGDMPRSDTEPSAHSTPRSRSPDFPQNRKPAPSSSLSSVSTPHLVDKGPQVSLTKTPRDSNNNGTAEDNHELRNSDDSLKFSRCGSPDSLFDRPPPVPEKRFSLRSDAADSGFMSSCMSLLTTSSGYSYKPRGSYDAKLSIASIEEGYISSQSTDSPKENRHSHKLSIRSDCSFMSTGSSYFAEDELSDDDHHYHNHGEERPRETYSRVNSGVLPGKASRNAEVNRISSVSEAKRLDTDSKPTLRKSTLASSTLSDFRQILHENKKNQNKSGIMPPQGRRHSLPINALSPQSALRQKYLVCYNNDMAPVQDSSI
ncbi:uncharacterized protein LOC135487009 [Lineus longissimus]|uniref:uncharacterized protein LOC135487009 n=1 Tax=Lineus longissimus TaxID=88925 RepID=UPI002B4DEB6D